MKWLLAPFLWIAAAVVAAWIVYRLWRGKPMILRGKLGPRVLRIVAILLVTLGLGVDDRPAQAAQPGRFLPPDLAGGPRVAPELPATLPENLTLAQIDQWLGHQREGVADAFALQPAHVAWKGFKGIYARIQANPTAANTANLRTLLRDALKSYPPPFATLIEADLKAWEAGKEPPRRTAKEVLAAYQAMDGLSYFDPWLVAYLWRHTASVDATREPEAVELFTRLARHVRIVQALYRARAQVQPGDIGPRAWMSKAGPGPNVTRSGFDRIGLAQMAKVYIDEAGKADLGPWRQDGVALLKMPEKGPLPTLLRAGEKVELKPGETLRLGRLDVLLTPAEGDVVLDHAVFGKLKLPAGQKLLVWDLARLLDDDARRLVSTAVRAALDGKDDAARLVEQALPLCQVLLREELLRQPGAPGAAKLRLILSLFDDAVIAPPVPVNPPAVPNLLPGLGGPQGPGLPPRGQP